ncbi:MAG: hypothetical protein ABIV36_22540 [Sphingobium limneticum]
MRPDADPPAINMHPALFFGMCVVGAAMWTGAFKLLAALCRAIGGTL